MALVINKFVASLTEGFQRGDGTIIRNILQIEIDRLTERLKGADEMNTVRHLQGQLYVLDNVLKSLS